MVDVNRECIKVTLVVRPSSSGPTTSTTSTAGTSSTSTAGATTSAPSTSITATTSTAPGPTNTALPYTDMTAQGFRFIGCAPEERRTVPFDFLGRTLPSAHYDEDAMTNEKCMAFCANAGYTYAGTEWSRECWCANAYAPTRQPAATLASLASCNFRCSGSAAQFCGGDAWLSLYEKCPADGPCVNNVFT